MRIVYLIITICSISAITIIYIIINKKKFLSEWEVEADKYSIESIIEFIKEEFNNLTRTSLENQGLSAQMYDRQVKQRSKLMSSLKRCIFGSINDKQYLKDMIYDILDKKYLNNDNIDKVIHFNNANLMSACDLFDIILHNYKKHYAADAFKQIVEKYQLSKLKRIDSDTEGYEISADDIRRIYSNESIALSYKDKLEIISQRVYQHYKGFSVVDELRDMNVDGISGAVSGITSDNMAEVFSESFMKRVHKNYESVWVFYGGKSIHLSFLSFGSYDELKRVCQNIYRYNNAGMLSKDIGFKVNDMLDGSRIVVVRPDFSESWAFFVRKFNTKHIKLEKLLTDKNSKYPIDMIKFLAKGACITSITGAQASGKTTLLMAMVAHIYGTLNIRVQEMAFELNLRKLYPYRNILSFRETPTISGQMGLDLQKKTDGSVLIIGEVATDAVAAWMIQTAQVASAFTIFTHHSKTVNDLVLSLRNSLLKCDIFRDEKIAEEQVVGVLDFDIHLSRDYSGKRYISRITEIIPIREHREIGIDLEGLSESEQNLAFMQGALQYFKNMSERKSFIQRDIIVFVDGEYRVQNSISDERIKKMKSAMTQDDIILFTEFVHTINLALENQKYEIATP